jgi:tRNA-2-methylthio-N6-dimethylallyladenosine synthase
MAQRLGDTLTGKDYGVDLVAGTDSYGRLAELLESAEQTSPVVDTTVDPSVDYSGMPFSAPNVFAFLSIMRGCNNFCSNCIVPYVRGRERNRRLRDVTDEFQRMGDSGVKQVTVIGQKVNAYQDPDSDTGFTELLETLDKLDSRVKRIRFTTSHPSFFKPDFAERLAGMEKVAKWVHLPVQSGSDGILRAMRRGYSSGEYLNLVENLRKTIPGIGISTDIMVGFPGETKADFTDTLKLVEEAKFEAAFMFAYSRREGTRAARLPDDPPLSVRKARLAELIEVQKAITIKVNEKRVGSILDVMLEKPSHKNPDEWFGRAEDNSPVVVGNIGTAEKGDILKVRILEARTHTLFGEISGIL